MRSPGGRCCGGKFGGRRARDAALPGTGLGGIRGWVCGAGEAPRGPAGEPGGLRTGLEGLGGAGGGRRGRAAVGGRGLRGCGGQRGGGRGQGLSPREPRRSTVCVPPPEGSVRGAGRLRALAHALGSCPGPPHRRPPGARPRSASAWRHGLRLHSLLFDLSPRVLRSLRLVFLCTWEGVRVFVIKVRWPYAHEPPSCMVYAWELDHR